jgi:hypothetical protein
MADELLAILHRYGLAYVFAAPRTGKTRTAFKVANELPVKSVLFLTKKMAIPGILKESFVCTKRVTVVNYEQIGKLSPADFDFVVVDEAHCVGTVGKPSKRFKEIKAFCKGLPVLLMSGTPLVETPLAAYYQLGVSSWSPFKDHKNFYDFFRTFGIPSPIYIQGRTVESYKRHREELLPVIDQYMVRLTQHEAGITSQAEDRVHYVTLQPATIELIKTLKEHGIASGIVCETDSAIRAAAHQIEAGAVLLNDQLKMLPNCEFVDYIRQHFGDSADVAVMAHFRSTRAKIAEHLPNVHVYSSDGHAEGVDLSHYKHFVIVNSGYAGSKFVQRRERGTRMDIKTPRLVHHLVVKGQLSEAVYKQVSRKLSFNTRHLLQWLHADRAANSNPHTRLFEGGAQLLGGQSNPGQQKWGC